MGIFNQTFARWRARKDGDMQSFHIARRQRAPSPLRRSLQFSAAAFLGAAVIVQITTGQSRADQIENLQEELAQANLAFDLTLSFGALPLPMIFRQANKVKDIEQRIFEAKRDGGDDPLYGTVTALGTTAGNTVSVMAIGFGSEVTAAGWGDTDAGTLHAIRWTLSGGTQDLGTLLGSAGNTFAYGMSDDASTIVGWSNTTPGTFPSGQHAFRWTQGGGMQDLGSLQGAAGTSIAYAANGDGSVVVGETDMPPQGGIAVPPHAFRWTQAGGMQDLGSLGLDSTAYAVNSDGSVVVGYGGLAAGGRRGFRWTQATGMQDLGTLSGLNQAAATSVSGDGAIVVGYADPTTAQNGATGWALSGSSRPFRWTQATGIQDLNTLLNAGGVNMTGTTITTALAITRDGTDIGGSVLFSTTPSGSIDTYLARHCDATNAAACALLALRVHTHDYNGDGRSDIAWRDSSGNGALWLMNGATLSSSAGIGNVPTNWSIVGQRDFNGDGKYDLLWRDGSGNTAMWFLNGTQVASAAAVGVIPTVWTVVGTADFNGDGNGDILWRDTSGNLSMWLMNSASVASAAGVGNVPLTWTIVGTGDFNADGNADLLWHDTSGNTAIWFMKDGQVSSSAGVGNIPTNWSVVGTGDFNGDGKSDILWRDNAGNTSIWLMNGAAILSAGGLGNIPTTWSIVQTGDYDGDGHSDLLWRDGSGNTSIWFMDGLTISSTAGLGNIPTNWTVQSVNAE
jgi:probable HAF family extracellular repeat protein